MARKASEFLELDSNPDKPDFGDPRRRTITPLGAVEVEPTLYVVDDRKVSLRTFEIGLVLAGAVSAGSYTAGVLDFLIEALDRWERAKEQNIRDHGDAFEKWTVPPHAVRIVAVAGASAGSVCAATFAATADKSFPPCSDLPTAPQPLDPPASPSPNPLYDLWVRRLDIVPMLDPGDFFSGQALGEVQSLLNTQPLDDGAAHIVRLTTDLGPAGPRRWLAKGVAFGFTLGNLTGIPYRYNLVGLDGADFATRRHSDMFTFRIVGADEAGSLPQDCVPGTPVCGAADGLRLLSWTEVANAALASGAFPVALKPRSMERSTASYDREIRLDARYLDLPGPVGSVDIKAWRQGANIVAGTVTSTLTEPVLNFTAVDGGTMNNQPFEFVRRTLAGPMGRNPREGHLANRAVVLVDPFPAQEEPEPADMQTSAETAQLVRRQKPVAIMDVLLRLLGAYVNQARYDANDLAIAADPDVYSRFMLSPLRARDKSADAADGPGQETLTGERALASGGLNAFAGFLGMALRHHDFLLGRRNAEYFLRTYFTLPANNCLFEPRYWDRMGDERAPKGPYWAINSDPPQAEGAERVHARQIVPVVLPAEVDPAAHEPALRARSEEERIWAARTRLLEPHPEWPGRPGLVDAIVARVQPHLEQRARRLVVVARDSFETGWSAILIRQLLWWPRGWIARTLARKAAETIRRQLTEAGLDRLSTPPTIRPPGVDPH